MAVPVDKDERRQILAIELANRESRSSWRDFLFGLRRRGLAGVEFAAAPIIPASSKRKSKLRWAHWQYCQGTLEFADGIVGLAAARDLIADPLQLGPGNNAGGPGNNAGEIPLLPGATELMPPFPRGPATMPGKFCSCLRLFGLKALQ